MFLPKLDAPRLGFVESTNCLKSMSILIFIIKTNLLTTQVYRILRYTILRIILKLIFIRFGAISFFL